VKIIKPNIISFVSWMRVWHFLLLLFCIKDGGHFCSMCSMTTLVSTMY